MAFRKAYSLALTFALAAAIPQSSLPAGIADLPACALNGLPAVLAASGCQGIDVNCLCSKPDLPAQLDSAVQTACSDQSDRDKIMAFVAGFCPRSSTSTPASTSTMSTSSATSAAESTTMPMTTSTTETSTMMPSASPSGSMNGTNSTTPTYNSPSPSDTAAPTSEGGASNLGVSAIAFVVAMGGMTWAFAEL